MARPRTLRTMIRRIGDKQLIAMWDLRTLSTSHDRAVVNSAIYERIQDIRKNRELDMLGYECPCKSCNGGRW